MRRGPLAAFFAFGLLWGSWAVLVPAVQLAVGASKGGLGLALLFVAVGSVPAMLLAGRAVDRYGTRILPWLLLALGAAAVLPGLAGSLPLLATGLLLLGSASVRREWSGSASARSNASSAPGKGPWSR